MPHTDDIIEDLWAWLHAPAEARQDATGAVRILKEIRLSHGELLAACEAALQPESYQGDGRPWSDLLQRLRLAVARAKGEFHAT